MRTAILVIAVVLSAAVLRADDHTVLFDDDADFSSFKTFTVANGTVRSERPELNSPLVIKKLGDAVRTALTSAGLKETATRGDLMATVIVSAVDYGIGPGGRANPIRPRRSGGAGGPAILQADFTEATLVVDLKKLAPDTLVWRGVYHDSENNPAKLAGTLPKDVARLLSEYPPRKKK